LSFFISQREASLIYHCYHWVEQLGGAGVDGFKSDRGY
jgi:hypothetical protein